MFGLTLETLLKLTIPEEVVWLSGGPAEAANILVDWVTAVPEAGGGRPVYILPASDLTPLGVAAAKEKGVVAVIAVGAVRYPARFRDAEIPVVGLPERDDLHTLHRNLLTNLINRRAYLMEQGNRLHARLTQLSAEGAGLEGLAAAMGEVSARGVVVQDKRMDVLACWCPRPLEHVWEALLAEIGGRDSLPEVLRDRKIAGRQSDLRHQVLSNGMARLVGSINVGGIARGYLSLIGRQGELDEFARLVVEEGVAVCAVEMSRSKAVRETEKRLKGDLLTALLRGELAAHDARLWIDRLGLSLEQAHVCLRFGWGSDSPPSLRRLETVLNAEVTRQEQTVIVSVLENEVVCFCQVPKGEVRPEKAISLGRSVIDRARLTSPDSSPQCGIGTPAEALEHWLTSFRQAGQALKMALRLSESKPLFFPDLSVYRLLLQIEGNPELKAFEEEILGSLLAYENSEELIRTLDAYFEFNGNLKRTARALYIHRNTLIYRLERIQEITGLDLSNPHTRLALQLTLHIHKMLGGR